MYHSTTFLILNPTLYEIKKIRNTLHFKFPQNQHRKRDPTSAELPNSGDYKPSAKVPRKTGPAEDNTGPA